MKIIANRLTSDKKSLFMVTNVSFYFLHTIYVMNTQIHLELADIAIVAKGDVFWLIIVTSPQLICDVMRTRDTGIVTSYSSIVITHANCHKDDLH